MQIIQQQTNNKKKWELRALNSFENQSDFENTFIQHVNQIIHSKSKRVQLRQNVLKYSYNITSLKRYKEQISNRHKIIQNVYENPNAQNNNVQNKKLISLDIICKFSDKRPQKKEFCIHFTTCSDYHMFDLSSIYQSFIKILNNKVDNKFSCPVCQNVVNKTSQIQLDIFSYEYYYATQYNDCIVDLILDKDEYPKEDEQKYRQIAQNSDETTIIIPNFQLQSQVIYLINTSLLNCFRKTPWFDEQRKKNEKLSRTLKQAIFSAQSFLFHNQFIPKHKQNLIINLICPLSNRRIFNPLLHRDCKHKEIIVFDLEYVLTQIFKSEQTSVKVSTQLMYTESNLPIKCKHLKCSLCNSQFTYENFLKVAVIDTTLQKWILKQPAYYNQLKIQNGIYVSCSQRKTIKILQTENEFKNILQIKKKVGMFWKQLFFDQSESSLRDLSTSLKIKYSMTKNKKQEVIYPVRCKYCTKSLNYIDLWSFISHFCSNPQKFSCPINGCELNNQDPIYKQIYLDRSLYKLLNNQHIKNTTKLIHNKKSIQYFPVIQQIKSLKMLISLTNLHVKNNQYYYCTDFVLKVPYEKSQIKQLKKTKGKIHIFILKSCLQIQKFTKSEQNSSSMNQEYLSLKSIKSEESFSFLEHIIYFNQKQESQFKLENLKCQKCNKKIENFVDEILYDDILSREFNTHYMAKIRWNSSKKIFLNKFELRKINANHFMMEKKISLNVKSNKQLKSEEMKLKQIIDIKNDSISYDLKILDAESKQEKYIEDMPKNKFEDMLVNLFQEQDNQNGIYLYQSAQRSRKYIDEKISKQVEEQLNKQNDPILGSNLMIILGNYLKKLDKVVSFISEPTPLSILSFYHIFTQLGSNKKKQIVQIQLNQNFAFIGTGENIPQNVTELQQYASEKLQAYHSVSEQKIKINKIKKIKDKRIQVEYYLMLDLGEEVKPIKSNPQIFSYKSFEHEEVFKHIQLDMRYLSDWEKGYVDFNKTVAEKSYRGYYPYYQPNGWIRYGLNVSKFTQLDGNDNWIKMEGTDYNFSDMQKPIIKNQFSEWAVFYHGLTNPAQSVQPIIQEGFRSGPNQYEKNSELFISKSLIYALSKKGIDIDTYKKKLRSQNDDEKVGVGIYGTPLINTVCVGDGYASCQIINNKKYRIAFQCRVEPTQIRISKKIPQYWLVRHQKYIRPYGLLIGLDQQINSPINKKKTKQFLDDYQQKFLEKGICPIF